MARKTLTDKGVGALKSRTKLYAHPDPQLPGHYIRVSPTGSKSFVAVARDPRGKQIWTTIGSASLISVEDSREKAREVIKRIKAGEDRVGPQSFQTVAEEWLRRHVEAKGLRSDSKSDACSIVTSFRCWAVVTSFQFVAVRSPSC
jgi:Arm DNA-binding domain